MAAYASGMRSPMRLSIAADVEPVYKEDDESVCKPTTSSSLSPFVEPQDQTISSPADGLPSIDEPTSPSEIKDQTTSLLADGLPSINEPTSPSEIKDQTISLPADGLPSIIEPTSPSEIKEQPISLPVAADDSSASVDVPTSPSQVRLRSLRRQSRSGAMQQSASQIQIGPGDSLLKDEVVKEDGEPAITSPFEVTMCNCGPKI